MASQPSPVPAGALPEYVAAARPNPLENRSPWYKAIAPTYAGIFLWFAFWDQIALNGQLNVSGLALALVGVVIAAVICHFLFYLIPGRLGQRTGLPLYVVGTSTFGTTGGLIMPGLLMGLLQFGWLGVNTYYSSRALAGGADNTPLFYALCVVWGAGAAFVGLKGIQYVAKVATFLPLIPLAVLFLGLCRFGPSAASYQPEPVTGLITAATPTPVLALLGMVAYIVGFFATAGAAGVDIASSGRDRNDVSLGGLVGILLAIVFTAGAALVIVAGARVQNLDVASVGEKASALVATDNLQAAFPGIAKAMMLGLALAAFPGACFSSLIAANSFKTTLPQVNSFVSVGLGALVSILLAVTGYAANLPSVFGIIGASFGPIVGAMCADYILAGNRWAGPRAGFNAAGWIAWAVGFVVGILPNLHTWTKGAVPSIPAAPVAAFVVGFVIYFALAKAGLEGKVVPYEPAERQAP